MSTFYKSRSHDKFWAQAATDETAERVERAFILQLLQSLNDKSNEVHSSFHSILKSRILELLFGIEVLLLI